MVAAQPRPPVYKVSFLKNNLGSRRRGCCEQQIYNSRRLRQDTNVHRKVNENGRLNRLAEWLGDSRVDDSEQRRDVHHPDRHAGDEPDVGTEVVLEEDGHPYILRVTVPEINLRQATPGPRGPGWRVSDN